MITYSKTFDLRLSIEELSLNNQDHTISGAFMTKISSVPVRFTYLHFIALFSEVCNKKEINFMIKYPNIEQCECRCQLLYALNYSEIIMYVEALK